MKQQKRKSDAAADAYFLEGEGWGQEIYDLSLLIKIQDIWSR